MEKQKLVIGVVGEIASGKGTFAKYANEKYNAKTLRFSDYFRSILDILGLDIDRPNMVALSGALRQLFGESVFSRAMYRTITADSANLVIVDGIRRIQDMDGLKNIPGFVLVFITSDQKIRYERLASRNENTDDRKKTFEEFIEESKAETEKTIAPLMETADYVIDNSGTMEEFVAKIDEFMKKIQAI